VEWSDLSLKGEAFYDFYYKSKKAVYIEKTAPIGAA
jgi:hypothetical protein